MPNRIRFVISVGHLIARSMRGALVAARFAPWKSSFAVMPPHNSTVKVLQPRAKNTSSLSASRSDAKVPFVAFSEVVCLRPSRAWTMRAVWEA